MRIRCLRAVRGNGATLLFESLVIDLDPEPTTDRINFGRRRKRMSPDDVLEQSDFARATLDLTCDPVGSLMIAMRIVSPADKKRSQRRCRLRNQRWRRSRVRLLRLQTGTKRSGSLRKSISSGFNPSSAPACFASSSRRAASRSGG